MPYKRVGKTIMHKKDGWSEKQTATSVENAEKAMNLLHGIEHGWVPPSKKKGHNCTTPVHEKFSNYDKY